MCLCPNLQHWSSSTIMPNAESHLYPYSNAARHAGTQSSFSKTPNPSLGISYPERAQSKQTPFVSSHGASSPLERRTVVARDKAFWADILGSSQIGTSTELTMYLRRADKGACAQLRSGVVSSATSRMLTHCKLHEPCHKSSQHCEYSQIYLFIGSVSRAMGPFPVASEVPSSRYTSFDSSHRRHCCFLPHRQPRIERWRPFWWGWLRKGVC